MLSAEAGVSLGGDDGRRGTGMSEADFQGGLEPEAADRCSDRDCLGKRDGRAGRVRVGGVVLVDNIAESAINLGQSDPQRRLPWNGPAYQAERAAR
jgi:hypothetical protein